MEDFGLQILNQNAGSSLCACLQVIAPPAARDWLQEQGGPQALRYRLLLNQEANNPRRAEISWLLHTTGMCSFLSSLSQSPSILLPQQCIGRCSFHATGMCSFLASLSQAPSILLPQHSTGRCSFHATGMCSFLASLSQAPTIILPRHCTGRCSFHATGMCSIPSSHFHLMSTFLTWHSNQS